MYVELFGQYYPYPIKSNKGEDGRRCWTGRWALQIRSDKVLYNHETAAKLRRNDSITLTAVCEWIDSSYEGILNSIREENECLKFEIRIFSKQMHLKFCKSWANNIPQYELQCILLNKEALVPGNRYSIRFMQFEISKEHKGANSYDAEDGSESDDSAFSSSSHQIQPYKLSSEETSDESMENYKHGIEEMKQSELKKLNQSFVEEINSIVKTETECLLSEYRRLAAKFETLNESVKSTATHQETMQSGRFRHLFQKTETIKQLHEETFSKVVQLESTVTESNALVYELHQKVDTLGKTIQRSCRNQNKEMQDVSSEYMEIKELLMRGEKIRNNDTPGYQELIELIKTLKRLKIPSCLSRGNKHLRRRSGDTDFDSNSSDVDTESNAMSENVTMDKSSTKQDATVENISDSSTSSQLEDTENSHCFGEFDGKQDQNQNCSHLDPDRPLSPTLEKALLEFEGDPLASDNEDLDQDRGGNTISSLRETDDKFNCGIQNTDICINSTDKKMDGKGFINDNDLKHVEIPAKSSQEKTKPEVKTMKIFPTEKLYSSGEVTVFLKDPEEEEEEEEEEDMYDNVMTMGGRTDRETGTSECDTDVENTLKASGLQISKPVVRTVKKALREDSPETRLHGLDTIICVDLSASMSNKSLAQIQATLYSFLDVVEDVAIDVGLEENLGLVTFSKETQICVQLTNDYAKLRSAIENLKPSGTSPLHTALSLCRLELKRNGHATRIHEHCVAPRIILFTDGRPTRDFQMYESESEYAHKDPQTLDDISSFVQQMGSEGIQLYTVGTGRQTNKDFLEKLAYFGGGQYHELNNITVLAKYFRDQFIVGKVIHEHRESGWNDDYKAYLQEILRINTLRVENEDEERIEELIMQSEELFDAEYPGLPKLGSRVQTKDGRRGTVVKHRKQNWVKIQFDKDDEIMYFHFIPNANNRELQMINIPRRWENHCPTYVGMLKYTYKHLNRIEGHVYDRTESGFLKIKWEDGSKDIVKDTDI